MKIDFPIDIDIFDSEAQVAESLANLLDSASGDHLIISGPTKSSAYADRVLGGYNAKPLHRMVLHTNSVSEVSSVERALRHNTPAIIVAIGGGKVGDFAKRLAYMNNIPLLLIPTIIANDGLISPIAVLQDEGKSVSLPGRMPDTVLIDIQMIGTSPNVYLRSAASDLITNISATNDWERAMSGDIARVHHLALQMSRMAAHMVLHCSDWDSDSPVFLKTIIYGQMLSGIAMALAGSSRPCSGSEHLIAHALDSQSLGMDTLHGEKVGITSRFCLHLQQMMDPKIEAFFQEFGVSRIFPGCERYTEAQIAELFSLSRKMRPGRETVLDNYSDTDLAGRYLDYVSSSEGGTP